MSRPSNLNVTENDLPSHLPDDSDWDAPTDPFQYGDNETLVRRIRDQAGDKALPYETRCTLYHAAARIEWLAARAK